MSAVAVVAERRAVVPIKWWAAFGALWLAFMAYVLVSWITGPFFERVPVGAHDPPQYMKVFLTFLQVTMLPAMAGCWWWFVVRPWRRDGRLSVDSALVIAYSTLFFQDPLSNVYGHWITYNAWSFNRGSWVNDVPGWLSYGEPGAMVVEPPLTIVGLYVVIMLVAVRIGVAVLRRASTRWPQMGKVGLGLICSLQPLPRRLPRVPAARGAARRGAADGVLVPALLPRRHLRRADGAAMPARKARRMTLIEDRGTAARVVVPPAAFARVNAVKWWAALGAAVLLAQAAILTDWVFSPFFHHVDSGPSPVPDYMKISVIAWQVILPFAGLAIIYRFVVRPWRRERCLGVDGLLVCAFSTLWFADPLSAYGGEWFTYNAWMVNMGSWVHSVPGWLSPGTPEHQIAYPLLVVPGAYICIFLLVSYLGASLMRAIKARRPQSGRLALVACCYLAMVLFDVLFEGIVFMPLGAWEYPGGHWAIFPGRFHKYPLNEALSTGLIFTSFASIKYFVDDRGQTLAERGADALRGTPRRTWAVRALAVTGLVQLAMFLGYTFPNTIVGLHGTQWNKDTQQRSYLTYTCGELAERPCPPSAVKP